MKHAKTILLAAASAVVLSLALQASGLDEVLEARRMPWEDTPEAVRAEWNAILKNMGEKGRAAFPELALAMDRSDLGSWYLEYAFTRIAQVDGWDIHTRGDPHLLASARGILPKLLDDDKRYKCNTVRCGLIYLAQKGDARDFPLFEKYMADPVLWKILLDRPPPTPEEDERQKSWLVMPYRILQHRVAGTNIVQGTFEWKWYPYFDNFFPHDSLSYSTNNLRFIPSVANTGPQAAYVYEAMEQAINKMWAQDTVRRAEGETVERRGSLGGSPYRMLTGNAPELLTMRVWFDAKGEAVCDVDLTKHGIFVPGLRTADANVGTSDAVASPPPRRLSALPLAFVTGVLAALGALATLRKKPRQ